MGRETGLLTARDGYVLDKMFADWPPLTEEWLALLTRKRMLARMPADAPAPASLAAIDTRVAFRCASGLTDAHTLCLPGTYVPGSAFLPITTIYGLALLGLREGEAIGFDRPEGRRDWIVLEKVLFRPAAGKVGEDPVRPSFRLIAGGLEERAFAPANENGPGQGPGPSAA